MPFILLIKKQDMQVTWVWLISDVTRDRPKTDFTFSAENENGRKWNEISFSARNRNENENCYVFSAENENETQ